MSRSNTKTATATTTQRSSAPLRRGSGSRASANAPHLTSQRIAADLAAFKKAGGRIEVLGNTPLRPLSYSARSSARKAAPTAKSAKAAKK